MLFRITSRACWEKKGRKSVSKASPQWISLWHCFPSILFFMISKFVLNVPLKLCNIAPKNPYLPNGYNPLMGKLHMDLGSSSGCWVLLACSISESNTLWKDSFMLLLLRWDDLNRTNTLFRQEYLIGMCPTLKFKRLDFPMWIKKIKNFIRRFYICFIRLISSYIRHN